MNEWNLTAREQSILTAIAKCGAAKVAARELGISHRTVEVYLSNIRTKMRTPHTLLAVLQWDRYVFHRTAEYERAE